MEKNMTKEVSGFARDSVGKEGDSSEAVPGGKLKHVPAEESFEPPAMLTAVCTYISYAVLIIFGHIADILRRLGLKRDKVFAGSLGVVSIATDLTLG